MTAHLRTWFGTALIVTFKNSRLLPMTGSWGLFKQHLSKDLHLLVEAVVLRVPAITIINTVDSVERARERRMAVVTMAMDRQTGTIRGMKIETNPRPPLRGAAK